MSANTFPRSQIIHEVKNVKLPSDSGLSDSDRVTKKMDKVELRVLEIKKYQKLHNFW